MHTKNNNHPYTCPPRMEKVGSVFPFSRVFRVIINPHACESGNIRPTFILYSTLLKYSLLYSTGVHLRLLLLE